MQPFANPFGPEALAQAMQAIENQENYVPEATELDLWLEQVTSPEYATVLGEAADRLSRAEYTAHEAPILEALQGLDDADNTVILATVESILIEAYVSYLTTNGIFINEDIDWTSLDIKVLSDIGFALRNIGEFYDPVGGMEIIANLESSTDSLATLFSLVTDTRYEDMVRLINKVDDELMDAIGSVFQEVTDNMESEIGPVDDLIVAQRELVRKRLIKFNNRFNPTFVKRYLARDCKIGLDVGEQLTETAPLFLTLIDGVDFAPELAGILCLSSIPSSDMVRTMNSILDEIEVDMDQLTQAKRWVRENEEFLGALDNEES